MRVFPLLPPCVRLEQAAMAEEEARTRRHRAALLKRERAREALERDRMRREELRTRFHLVRPQRREEGKEFTPPSVRARWSRCRGYSANWRGALR